MNISRFFIDRPIFAAVLSIIIFVAGLISIFQLPISEYPDVVPPSVVVHAQFPGANPTVIAETVATPLEEQINGVENMLYMSSQATADGSLQLTVTFKIGTNVEQAETRRAEPRAARVAAAARRGAADRRDDDQELARPHDGRAPEVAERALRRDLPAQLRGAERQGPARAHPRHGPGAAVRRRRLRDADLARSAEARGAQPDGARRRRGDPRAERAGRGRRRRRVADEGRAVPAVGQHARPAVDRGRVRRHHRQDRRRRRPGRGHAPARRRAHRDGRVRVRAALAARQQAGRRDPAVRGARRERARSCRPTSARRWRS